MSSLRVVATTLLLDSRTKRMRGKSGERCEAGSGSSGSSFMEITDGPHCPTRIARLLQSMLSLISGTSASVCRMAHRPSRLRVACKPQQ